MNKTAKKRTNYILVIDPNSSYDMNYLGTQLDLCLDWVRLFACTYIINSNSDKEHLYNRFKKVFDDDMFFLGEIDLPANQYTGWLKESKWNKLRELKIKVNK